MKKAIFLDRDGTLIYDKCYIHSSSDVEFITGVYDALLNFRNSGYILIVITNQSGVGRGYFSSEDVDGVNLYIKNKLYHKGIEIEGFYYCPHYVGSSESCYDIDCNCRKPKIGLILQAVKENNIDLNKSYMIGDKEIDVITGNNAGVKKSFKVDAEHDLLYYSKIICFSDVNE